MTIEELKSRLALVEKSMQQVIANYNSLEGGKQEILHWIAQLEEKAKLAEGEVIPT